MEAIEIQGTCLVNSPHGERLGFMREVFDKLPVNHQRALARSRFNICAACYKQALVNNVDAAPEEIVAAIENKILEQETQP